MPFNAPNIAKSHFVQGTEENRARQLVEDRLNLSLRRYGGQNARFRELNRYYLSLTPRITGRENDRPLNSKTSREPDLFVPRFYSIIEGAVPMFLFGVLGGHPPVRVHGRKPSWHEKASMLEKLVTYDFDRARVMFNSIHVAKQMFKYGTGIAKIGYKYDEYDVTRSYDKSVPVGFTKDGRLRWQTRVVKSRDSVTRYDGPTVEPWNVYNFHPDPFYWRLEDMRYVCARRWTDRRTLELEDENYYRFSGEHLYRHLDRIPRIKRGYIEEVYQMDHGDDLGEAMGWSNSFGIGHNRYTASASADESEDLVEIVEYWDRDDRVVYLANGETPILDTPNPYDDKEIPFVVSRCTILDNHFWGYGLLHPTQRSQEELNSLRNLNLRQAQLNILNIWGYDEGTGLAQIATHFDPGDVIPIPFFANGNPGLVPLFQGRPLPPEAYQYEDRIDLDIQTAIASPGYRAGAGSGSGTATEATIDEERAQTRIRLQNLMGNLTYASEIARLFISRRQQFLSDEGQVIRITGAEGVEFETLTREDVAGEYDFVPGGQHIIPGKDVLRQQILQLWALQGNNPTIAQMLKSEELMEETLKLFDFEHPERFMQPLPSQNPFATRPDLEGKVLYVGERIDATKMENHEQHMQAHAQELQRAVQEGNERAEFAIRQHMQQHQKYLQEIEALKAEQQQLNAREGGTPPQEQPGLRGYAGTVPNLQNAVETSGGLAARTRGGAG